MNQLCALLSSTHCRAVWAKCTGYKGLDISICEQCRQVSNIGRTLVGNYIVDHLDVVVTSHIHSQLNTMTREAFKFWDLVRLILEALRYVNSLDVAHVGKILWWSDSILICIHLWKSDDQIIHIWGVLDCADNFGSPMGSFEFAFGKPNMLFGSQHPNFDVIPFILYN